MEYVPVLGLQTLAPTLSPAGRLRNKIRALGEDVRSYPETASLSDKQIVEWEPFDTAPKDGTLIWLRRSDRRHVAARWSCEGAGDLCWRDLVTGLAIATTGAIYTHWSTASVEAVLRDEVKRLRRARVRLSDQLLGQQSKLLAETHRANVAAARLLQFSDARALLHQARENRELTTTVQTGPLLEARDALVRGDVEEAFHHLVILADPHLSKNFEDLWREWEASSMSMHAMHPSRPPSPTYTSDRAVALSTPVEAGNVAGLGRPLSRLEWRILDHAVRPLGYAPRWDSRWYERMATRRVRKTVDSLVAGALLTAWGAAEWDVWKATPAGFRVHAMLHDNSPPAEHRNR